MDDNIRRRIAKIGLGLPSNETLVSHRTHDAGIQPAQRDEMKKRGREWIRESTKGRDATRKTTEARKRELQERTVREYAIRGGENVETKRTTPCASSRRC
jgi:hypothetical protein